MGANLRDFREQEGKSCKEFAEYIGYHRLDLAKLEYGEKNIRLGTAKRIAQRLDIYLPRLFSDKEFQEYLSISPSDRLGYVDDDYLKIFIEEVRKCLVTRGSQAEIVMRTGMDASNVNKILNHKISDPCISTLDTLAQCLGKELSILISRTNDLRVREEE